MAGYQKALAVAAGSAPHFAPLACVSADHVMCGEGKYDGKYDRGERDDKVGRGVPLEGAFLPQRR